MRAFWYFKSAVNTFMKVFIMLTPIISLVGAVYECWECVKYESAEFIDILLIALNVFIFLIFGALVLSVSIFRDFFTTHKIFEKVLFTPLAWGFIMCCIGLVLVGIINIVYVHVEQHPVLVALFLIAVTIFCLLYAFRNAFLQYLTPKSLIAYRITLVIFVIISSLLYLLLAVSAYMIDDDNAYNMCSLAASVVCLWVAYLIFFHNFAYINYKRSRYLLVLRNFAMDEKIQEVGLLQEVEEVCNKLRLFFMRIGNPRKMLDLTVGKTVYLNTVNWKEPVAKYIKDSEVVITVVSSSDGLFWEIFNHFQYSSKFIYHILDLAKMRESLKRGEYERIKYTKFGGLLYFVCLAYNGPFVFDKDRPNFNISFSFNDERLVVGGDLSLMIQYLCDKDRTSTKYKYINEIPIECDGDEIYICYEDAKYLIKNSERYD